MGTGSETQSALSSKYGYTSCYVKSISYTGIA